jgi:hypothetical protein
MALTKITSKMTDDTIPQKTAHGAMKLPVGATGQRPTGEAGDLRYNSTTGEFEGYTTEWGSIGGGIGDEYISATPTLSSSEANKITVTNHSVYTNVTYKVYAGSTLFPHLQNGGELVLQPTTGGSVSLTVVATEVGVGKLFSNNSSAITVALELKSARYWRLTGWLRSSTIGLRVGHFNVHTGANGTGTTATANSQFSANRAASGNPASYARGTNLGYNWYDNSPYLGATDWIMIDMSSAVDINSFRIGFANNATYYKARKVILERSNDNSTWTEVAIFGIDGVTGSPTVLSAAGTAIQTFNRTTEWN